VEGKTTLLPKREKKKGGRVSNTTLKKTRPTQKKEKGGVEKRKGNFIVSCS